MADIKKILLVIDEREKNEGTVERVLKHAHDHHRASVTVCGLLDTSHRYPHRNTFLGNLEELIENAVSKKQEALAQTLSHFHEPDLEINTRVLRGNAAAAIICEVIANGHDIVALATGAGEDQPFEHLDMRLLRKCPCPVWIMRPMKRHPYRSIMACVDPDPFNEERDAMNADILDTAIDFAKADGGVLHVVHCYEGLIDSTVLAYAGVSVRDLEEQLQEFEALQIAAVDALLEPCDLTGLEVKKHVLDGSATKLIPSLAEKNGVELMVLGTVSRSGIAGFFLGNTAESVLQQVKCSVVAVKPAGFKSPVQLESDR